MTLVKRQRWSSNENISTEATVTIDNSNTSNASSTEENRSASTASQSKPVRHLFLVRHGQYQRRRTQFDGHLTAKGQKQAWHTANFLRSQLPDDVPFDSLTHSNSKTRSSNRAHLTLLNGIAF